MDTSDYGLSHNFKSPGVVEIRLTDIKIALVKCLFIFNWSSLKFIELNLDFYWSSPSGRSLNSAHRWPYTRKLIFVWGFQPRNLPKNFWHTLLLNYVSPNHRRKKSHCHLYQTSYNVHCFAIVMLNATGIMINTVTSGSHCRSKILFTFYALCTEKLIFQWLLSFKLSSCELHQQKICQ